IRSEDAVAQLLLQTGHQGERDHQRHHADGDAERRDERDHRDERLFAFGEEVSKRDMKLERNAFGGGGSGGRRDGRRRREPLARWVSGGRRTLRAIHSRFLISGKRITSRIDGLLVSSITRRSMPTPSPPVGGSPYSSARM